MGEAVYAGFGRRGASRLCWAEFHDRGLRQPEKCCTIAVIDRFSLQPDWFQVPVNFISLNRCDCGQTGSPSVNDHKHLPWMAGDGNRRRGTKIYGWASSTWQVLPWMTGFLQAVLQPLGRKMIQNRDRPGFIIALGFLLKVFFCGGSGIPTFPHVLTILGLRNAYGNLGFLAEIFRFDTFLERMGGSIGWGRCARVARQDQTLDGPGCDYDFRIRRACHPLLPITYWPVQKRDGVLARHAYSSPRHGNFAGPFVLLCHFADNDQPAVESVFAHPLQQHPQ
jgi:hypothetical protein